MSAPHTPPPAGPDGDDNRDGAGGLRPAAVAGGTLVLAIVAALAWLAFDSSPRPPARSGPSALREAVRLPEVWAVPPPVIESAVAVLPPAVSVPGAAPAVPPGKLDICGVGLVDEAAWNSDARVEASAASLTATRRRVTALLRADASEEARAIGLALDANDADSGTAGTALDRLAWLAATTRSPQVHALAWRQCQTAASRADAPSCNMVSADQWARLDPGNAAAWLAVATSAKARGDAAAVGEALYRVSQASTVEDPTGRFTRVLIEHLPTGTSELESVALAAQAFGLDTGGAMSSWHVVSNECGVERLADANRRQRCEAIADIVWRRSTNLLDLSMALALAKRAGWPPERLQAMGNERDALVNAALSLTGDQPMSCTSIRKSMQHLQAVGRIGEVASLREVVSASGLPLADWARRSPRPPAATQARAEDAASAPTALR